MSFACEGVWDMGYCRPMGYGVHFPTHKVGGRLRLWVKRGYGLPEVWVKRGSTVPTWSSSLSHHYLMTSKLGQPKNSDFLFFLSINLVSQGKGFVRGNFHTFKAEHNSKSLTVLIWQ